MAMEKRRTRQLLLRAVGWRGLLVNQQAMPHVRNPSRRRPLKPTFTLGFAT
jgi:hypothetical protein